MTDFRVVDHPVPAPPNVVASLPEVLIPMLWWRGVPMRRAQLVSMTPLERFVLEMALRVGEAEPDEFFEITGLPGALLPVAARRLVGSKALQRRADAFTPCFPGAEHAFRTQTLYEERHTSFDVVLLPRTGDLIALDPRTSGLRALDKLRPRSVGNAPMPVAFIGANLADYLRDRLRNGSVAGLADDITDVALLPAESPPFPLDGWCPMYRCRGQVRLSGDKYIPSITYAGRQGRQSVALDLLGADGLTERWLELAELLDNRNALAQAWHIVMERNGHAVPHAERSVPGRWTCWVSAESARYLAELGRNLALPIGIAIQDEDAVVEVAIELGAADGAAREIIETDRLLTEAAQPGADTSGVPRTPTVSRRAWRLGFPGLVYTLREAEDFGYG